MPDSIGSAIDHNSANGTRPADDSQNIGGSACWNSQVNSVYDNVHRDSYRTKPDAAEYNANRLELPGVNRLTERQAVGW